MAIIHVPHSRSEKVFLGSNLVYSATLTSQHQVAVKLFTVILEKLSLKMISSFTYEYRNRYKKCLDILNTYLIEGDVNSLLWPCYGKLNGVLGGKYYDVVDLRNGTSKGKISFISSCKGPSSSSTVGVFTDTHLIGCIRQWRTLRIEIIESASGKLLLDRFLHRYSGSKIFNMLMKAMPNGDFICLIVLKNQLKFVYLRRQYNYTAIVHYVPKTRHYFTASTIAQYSQFIFIFFYRPLGKKLASVRLFRIKCIPNDIQSVEKDLNFYEETPFQLNYRWFPGNRYPVAVGERGDLRWIGRWTNALHVWWLSK